MISTSDKIMKVTITCKGCDKVVGVSDRHFLDDLQDYLEKATADIIAVWLIMSVCVDCWAKVRGGDLNIVISSSATLEPSVNFEIREMINEG